jgi:MYXO-CTERM domain-containing protein
MTKRRPDTGAAIRCAGAILALSFAAHAAPVALDPDVTLERLAPPADDAGSFASPESLPLIGALGPARAALSMLTELGEEPDPAGLARTRAHLLTEIAARRAEGPATNHKGERVTAQPVRYVQDFDPQVGELDEWAELRARAVDGYGRIAGPFRNASTTVRIHTDPAESYTVQFDLALVAARIGDPAVSDRFSVEVDGQPILEELFADLAEVAREHLEHPDDPLIYPKITLFFSAEHRITEISFTSTAEGLPGGEVWGLDNVIIDRSISAGGSFGGAGGSSRSAGFGAGGPASLAHRAGPNRFNNLPSGSGGGSSGGGGGGDTGFPGLGPRIIDEIPLPPDVNPTPAPDLPPVPEPEGDPKVPGNPDDPSPPVPTPGATVPLLFGLAALMRRRRAAA